MKINLEQLKEILPTNKNHHDWLDILNIYFNKYKINSPRRIAAFMSQCAHESRDFNILEENLNYSRRGLLITFPKYFNEKNVDSYSRQPSKIANLVYANRMNNGKAESGDGYKFRGRGLIQTTGKKNYTLYSNFIYGDNRCVINPQLLSEPKDALISACYFWDSNKLNDLSDINAIIKITKIVNGGKVGLDDRAKRFSDIVNLLY